MSPNESASVREILPSGIGLLAVRVITASMSASYHMLRTPAAPAPMAMARIAMNPTPGSILPGAIVKPTSAVKTASNITRGFISAKKSDRRAVNRDDEGKYGCRTETAVVFIVNSSRRQRYPREVHTRIDVVQSRASDDPPNGGVLAASKGDAGGKPINGRGRNRGSDAGAQLWRTIATTLQPQR